MDERHGRSPAASVLCSTTGRGYGRGLGSGLWGWGGLRRGRIPPDAAGRPRSLLPREELVLDGVRLESSPGDRAAIDQYLSGNGKRI